MILKEPNQIVEGKDLRAPNKRLSETQTLVCSEQGIGCPVFR